MYWSTRGRRRSCRGTRSPGTRGSRRSRMSPAGHSVVALALVEEEGADGPRSREGERRDSNPQPPGPQLGARERRGVLGITRLPSPEPPAERGWRPCSGASQPAFLPVIEGPARVHPPSTLRRGSLVSSELAETAALPCRRRGGVARFARSSSAGPTAEWHGSPPARVEGYACIESPSRGAERMYKVVMGRGRSPVRSVPTPRRFGALPARARRSAPEGAGRGPSRQLGA